MSRSRDETGFARMLGRTGALLAPALLKRPNVTDLAANALKIRIWTALIAILLIKFL